MGTSSGPYLDSQCRCLLVGIPIKRWFGLGASQLGRRPHSSWESTVDTCTSVKMLEAEAIHDRFRRLDFRMTFPIRVETDSIEVANLLNGIDEDLTEIWWIVVKN